MPAETEAGAGSPPASERAGPFGRFLGRLSEILALVGGAIVLFIVVMTVISIVGRYFFNLPVKGDFEITEIACGVAAFLFFPYTQYTGQNLIAEFFTSAVSARFRDWLDAVHTVIFALIAAFFAWRAYEGLIDKVVTAERTMLVGIPIWWPYAAAVAASALLAVVCLWCAARLIRAARA
jgi:TRAP-type C4-dicarboxylate transport system permease small subunit